MLEYIKSTERENINEVCKKYAHCKVLMSNLDMFDIANITGTVYAVSTSKKSFDDLCKAQLKLQKKGILAKIIGSYDDTSTEQEYCSDETQSITNEQEANMPKYVYVILCGCVGDVSIHKIYASEERANIEIERMNKDNYLKTTNPYIEKWEVVRRER